MRRRHRFPRRNYHLVDRTALGELWVKLLAEFASSAGARVETVYHGWINVFHE